MVEPLTVAVELDFDYVGDELVVAVKVRVLVSGLEPFSLLVCRYVSVSLHVLSLLVPRSHLPLSCQLWLNREVQVGHQKLLT